MNTYYKTVVWDFNRALWSQSIAKWVQAFSVKEVAELLNVSDGCISGWMRMHRVPDYPWPGMENFMRVVNELGLDPSDFFVEVDNG